MFITARDTKTGKELGYRFVCHGCGDVSKWRKKYKLPPRWVEVTESNYSPIGNRRVGTGFVVNCYCYACHSNGANARTVGAVIRKLCKNPKIKAILQGLT